MFYISTGYDFTSFFVGLSKVTFFKTLLRYSEFITGDTKVAPGSLASTNKGFLFLVRLVGSVYIGKNKPAFVDTSPTALLYHFKMRVWMFWNSTENSIMKLEKEYGLELVLNINYLQLLIPWSCIGCIPCGFSTTGNNLVVTKSTYCL